MKGGQIKFTSSVWALLVAVIVTCGVLLGGLLWVANIMLASGTNTQIDQILVSTVARIAIGDGGRAYPYSVFHDPNQSCFEGATYVRQPGITPHWNWPYPAQVTDASCNVPGFARNQLDKGGCNPILYRNKSGSGMLGGPRNVSIVYALADVTGAVVEQSIREARGMDRQSFLTEYDTFPQNPAEAIHDDILLDVDDFRITTKTCERFSLVQITGRL